MLQWIDQYCRNSTISWQSNDVNIHDNWVNMAITDRRLSSVNPSAWHTFYFQDEFGKPRRRFTGQPPRDLSRSSVALAKYQATLRDETSKPDRRLCTVLVQYGHRNTAFGALLPYSSAVPLSSCPAAAHKQPVGMADSRPNIMKLGEYPVLEWGVTR